MLQDFLSIALDPDQLGISAWLKQCHSPMCQLPAAEESEYWLPLPLRMKGIDFSFFQIHIFGIIKSRKVIEFLVKQN